MRMRWTNVLGMGIVSAALTIVAGGCGQADSKPNASSNVTPAATTGDALPGALFLTQAPAEAQDVAAAVKDAKDAQEIVLRGRVAGGRDPFTPSRAVMTVTDLSVKACNENPGDACASPWDLCCETPETIAANSATVQVVGTDGRPLKAGLKDAAGLKPLSQVVVRGTAQRPAGSKALVVNATGIYVQPHQ